MNPARLEILKKRFQIILCSPHPQPKAKAEPDSPPEAVCYRGQTLAIVRHFFELSCQLGRLPSIFGREFFRARVSRHAIPSFEDHAVFVHDVEQCLGHLSEQHAQYISLFGLYQFTQREAAELLHCSRTEASERFAEAIDALTGIFLKAGVLTRDKPDRKQVQVTGRSIPGVGNSLPPKKPGVSVSPGSLTQVVDQGGRTADGASRLPSGFQSR
jgi:hypothetical protein